MAYPVLEETIVAYPTAGYTTGNINARLNVHKRFNAFFYVGKPAAGTASGKDKTAVSDAVTAALACGQGSAVIDFSGGTYDVGDLAIVLPAYTTGPMLTFRGPMFTTLKFSVDRGAGTWAVMGGGTEFNLYFHTFDGVGLQGPGVRGTVGSPPTNSIGGGPTLMSGIWCGSRMKLRFGGVSGFRAGVQFMGNHIEIRSWNCSDNYYGVYFAQNYGNSGDVLIDNCALDGNLHSSIAVAVASIGTFKMQKGHLGFCPYAIYFEAGRTSGSALAMGGTQLDGTSIEFCGNGFIYDPSQFARISGFVCIQVGAYSTSPVTYRIPASAAAPWIQVYEFIGAKYIGAMPINGGGGAFDAALFDVTGFFHMESDYWTFSEFSCRNSSLPWILSTLAPKIVLTEAENDSEARVLLAAQTVAAGQVLEHNGQNTYKVRPYGYFGAGQRAPYAGVALNAAVAGSRTGVACVTRANKLAVQIDTVAANSYQLVADGTVAGKAKGIVYDGTTTSTNGRPLIGQSFFGVLVAGANNDAHITND